MQIESIKQEISALESAMAPVRALADKLAEMQSAVATLAQQERTLAALRQRLAAAEQQEACKQAAIARYRIESITPTEGGPAVHRNVQFMVVGHGLHCEEARPGSMALHGLSQEVGWALLADPKKLPPAIRVLADDPAEALRLHCKYARQGYAG